MKIAACNIRFANNNLQPCNIKIQPMQMVANNINQNQNQLPSLKEQKTNTGKKPQHKRSESLQLDGFNAFQSPNKHSLIKSIISPHVTPTHF